VAERRGRGYAVDRMTEIRIERCSETVQERSAGR
jgi:hypothetical protein